MDPEATLADEIRSWRGHKERPLDADTRRRLQHPHFLHQGGSAPTLGSAMLAAVGAGISPDIPTAAENMVHVERQIEPNQERHEEYRFFVDKYVETYPRMKELMHETVRHVAAPGGSKS